LAQHEVSRATARPITVASPQMAQQQQPARAEPIPLPPPSGRSAAEPRQSEPHRRGVAMIVTSSLAIVLGLFFLVVWLSRRALPKSQSALPTDVLEVLGRTTLATRHHLQLVRLGQRMLLISVSADGARTLAEIADPDEVNHLAALCKQEQPGSISASFRQVLDQLGTQSTPAAPAAESTRRGAASLASRSVKQA
jgi:flagellar biogenesis protein FliO